MSDTGLPPGIESGLSSAWDWTKGAAGSLGLNGYSPDNQQKVNNLNQVGQSALGFGTDAQNNYNKLSGMGYGALNGLQSIANGQNSVSAEQLRQGLQSNLATQQSMAAGASPNNAAMAARNAAQNMGRSAYGLSGQQAVAGQQERNAATSAYGNLLGQLNGQAVQGAVGGYGAATGAYSGGLNGTPAPTLASQLGGPIAGFIKAI